MLRWTSYQVEMLTLLKLGSLTNWVNQEMLKVLSRMQAQAIFEDGV